MGRIQGLLGGGRRGLAVVEEHGGLSLQHLDGQAVGDHHDDQRDEEGHEGANQHEVLLVHHAAAVHKHLVLIVQADHRDGHRDACKRGERKREDCQREEERKTKRNESQKVFKMDISE